MIDFGEKASSSAVTSNHSSGFPAATPLGAGLRAPEGTNGPFVSTKQSIPPWFWILLESLNATVWAPAASLTFPSLTHASDRWSGLGEIIISSRGSDFRSHSVHSPASSL